MTAATTTVRGTMPLAGHLREARRRATRAAVSLLIGIVIGFLLSDSILDVLRTPVEELAATRAASLNYDTVTGAFDLQLRIALFAGIIVSSPVWLRELFAYLAPGLNKREKKYVVGFSAAAAPLFAAGCAFGFLLFPRMVSVLAGFSSDQDSTILNASYYVDFVMKIVLATGIAFVLPAFLVMLNCLGIVSAHALRRSWRVMVVVIALFSALVTPAADVLSMFLVALPMSGLFGAALAITAVHDKRASRRSLHDTPLSTHS
ncbi:twin-arginine translocase subunit TatC [Rhodococcus sp. RS1C4]|uniref:twin-arginine translocase subunit TatC n=1 Tax=Nocardiaceae TaxID=85025 RepID=UPI000365748E|nr:MULTISPECIES: twin-arginine translocase subunit TatC [Rhodococcus]OZC58760.1 twin-arginine translocase subunit TatC [Rhodococcus sp. RS1C4]OZC92919.1 twin-arginine translocase subunit TatC [Rhodococcus sp. 06-418-1B]OZD07518.1 twin-arginine translocase subunit TatC [Rhodococcus sp. 06-156-4C]OZD17275.1 twin-arginine translocase subunit TatC [Rhodococcus sp. 06-156-3C]OZD18612.1 twin-arginine translocase subunit TatC [Rhodococcus sp. 06-156-4a]